VYLLRIAGEWITIIIDRTAVRDIFGPAAPILVKDIDTKKVIKKKLFMQIQKAKCYKKAWKLKVPEITFPKEDVWRVGV